MRRMTAIRGGHGALGAVRDDLSSSDPLLVLVAIVCRRRTVLPLLILTVTASPATAATDRSTLARGRVPHCPPDCGAVAAGDPLLVGFMTANPGDGWQAFPAAESQSYVNTLRRNLSRLAPTATTNVAAARWKSVTGDYSLLITLVSSTSLAKVRLQSPLGNAADLCSSARRGPCRLAHTHLRHPRRGGGHLRVPAQFHDQGRGRRRLRPGQRRRPHRGQLRVENRRRPSHHRAGRPPAVRGPPAGWGPRLERWSSMSNGSSFGSASSPRWRSASWPAPAEEGVGGDPSRPSPRPSDGGRWPSGCPSLAVIGAMAFSMLDSTVMRGFGEWYGLATFGDFWQNWADAAHMTFAGGFGHVYVLDSSLETAPALQVITAPIARLAFGLSFPYPSAVLYPTAYWVAGPLFLGGMALPICAGDRWLSGMGVTDIRRRLTVLGVMAITLPPIPLSGHPEDLIALGAMLYGLAAAFDERPRATGWWLGVALAFQPFAFLAIPIAFIFLKRRQWLTALGPMLAVPLAFLIVPVIADPSVTVAQLLHQKVYDVFGYIGPTLEPRPGGGGLHPLGGGPGRHPGGDRAGAIPARRAAGRGQPSWSGPWPCSSRSGSSSPSCSPTSWPRPWPWRPSARRGCRGGDSPRSARSRVWLTWWLHIAIQAKWSLWLILVAQLCLFGWLAYPGRVRDSPTARAPSANPPTVRPADRGPQLADRVQ